MSIRRASFVSACVLFLVAACASEGREGAHDDEQNAARECNPLPVKASPSPGNTAGLTPSHDVPMPALGPDAAGYFHPDRGYTEGGTFASAVDDPRWRVDPREIAAPTSAGRLRVAEWNVERGNKLDQAIRLMKKINADVWLLNETDLYGRNSSGVVVAREAARALGYTYYTAIEFYERRDDRRGTSGNAILSRFPLADVRAVEIPMLAAEGGHDWSKDTSEPRCGQRNAMAASVEVPTESGTRRLRLLSMHLENKANVSVRNLQLEHVVKELVRPGEPTIAAGDLNTVSPGEGSALRRALAAKNEREGRERTLFDCSRGDDTDTFSAAFFLKLRIDWVFAQSGEGLVLDCPAGSYRVLGNDRASDHKPVVVEMTVR